ncbi:MAG: hypothetical protein H0V54_05980 [Chthoniobacterales bacterium]|nr:hypothetical protein [Chthoniobacterales bacterium]
MNAEIYRKIDRLRGGESRSSWVQRLVEGEASRMERERLAERLREEYTVTVRRETLALNEAFPIHEK